MRTVKFQTKKLLKNLECLAYTHFILFSTLLFLLIQWIYHDQFFQYVPFQYALTLVSLFSHQWICNILNNILNWWLNEKWSKIQTYSNPKQINNRLHARWCSQSAALYQPHHDKPHRFLQWFLGNILPSL